jgi:hypothetical protein
LSRNCAAQWLSSPGSASAAADGDVLGRLHIEGYALDVRKLVGQTANDLIGARSPLIPRLELDVDAAGIEGRVPTASADRRRHRVNGGILQHDIDQRLLPLGHGLR